MSKVKIYGRQGSILILALWTLGFLVVLAIQSSYTIRQKMTLIQRLESRSQARQAAQAGIKKAMVMLAAQRGKKTKSLTVEEKEIYLNNSPMLSEIQLGQFVGEVTYLARLNFGEALIKRYGFIDESSKLNLNKASLDQIRTLLVKGLEMDEDSAFYLASAIYEWRTEGKTELVGFYSDEYYNQLQYPYVPKDAPFESLDELLLLRGMTEALYDKLIHFTTIYSNGAININTASAPVLIALGIDPYLVDKIITVRRGRDEREATEDDIVFPLPEYILLTLTPVIEITPREAQLIDDLVNQGKLVTDGPIYSIHARGFSEKGDQKTAISCVFEPQNGKIHYWREK